MHEIILERGRLRVTVVPEAGGRIAQIAFHDGAAWLPLLFDAGDVPVERRGAAAWGSFVMAPWPNRIAGKVFAFEGAAHEVAATLGGEALHGLCFDRAWSIDDAGPDTCAMSLTLDARWPWPGSVRQQIRIDDADTLVQRIAVEAEGGGRFLVGAGWHPWFRRDVRPGEDPRVFVDARERYALTPHMIPSGAVTAVEGDRDLRGYDALGLRRLDDCYRSVRQPIRICWGDIEMTMTSSANVAHAVVYTPATAFCVEPQTCAIDAFNLHARGIESGVQIVTADTPLVAETSWRVALTG